MPLDAVVLTALTAELSKQITGMKIDKVHQPERDLILLSLRGGHDSCRLLISAGAGSARMHVTRSEFENPQTPPMFCMLLRKHLQGARIARLVQPEMERLVMIELDAYDEMGEPARKKLVLEMIGRSTNLILIGPQGHIIDCLRRVDAEMNAERQILPGLLYRLPPKQEKPCFFEVGAAERLELWSHVDQDIAADKWLLNTFSALSPLICRELCSRCFGDASPQICRLPQAQKDDFPRAMQALADAVDKREFIPYIITGDEKPRDFSFMAITQYGGGAQGVVFDSFSELLEAFYTKRDKAERARLRAQSVTKIVKTARDRVRRKLAAQKDELLGSAGRERLRRAGDLITANIWRMGKGDRVLRAEDFYDELCPVTEIELDSMKTPQQNAAAYYKSYNKAKAAERHLTQLIEKGETELDYLNSVLEELGRAEGERDLADIRRELVQAGYIRPQKNAKKERLQPSKPLVFRSSGGMQILVGRNNAQNDHLTTKLARRTDIWLHAQKIHGSHVIISCDGQTPDDTTLEEAASLAAFYSQGRDAGKIPVDYTQARFVRKPNGAMPGKVIYNDYSTVIAQADELLAERMREK